MHAPAVVTAAGALALCAACGGTASRPSPAWRSNAAELVAQLRGDVDAVQSVAATPKAFSDTGELYVLLIAYADLSGCSAMAAHTAAPDSVIRLLARPCPHFERSARLFTQAEAVDDAHLLARAEREAARGSPALVRAAAGVR